MFVDGEIVEGGKDGRLWVYFFPCPIRQLANRAPTSRTKCTSPSALHNEQHQNSHHANRSHALPLHHARDPPQDHRPPAAIASQYTVPNLPPKPPPAGERALLARHTAPWTITSTISSPFPDSSSTTTHVAPPSCPASSRSGPSPEQTPKYPIWMFGWSSQCPASPPQPFSIPHSQPAFSLCSPLSSPQCSSTSFAQRSSPQPSGTEDDGRHMACSRSTGRAGRRAARPGKRNFLPRSGGWPRRERWWPVPVEGMWRTISTAFPISLYQKTSQVEAVFW